MIIQREGRRPIRLPQVFAERLIAKGVFRPVTPKEPEEVPEPVKKKRTKKAK
jgi:hypothetical protein